MLGGGSGLAWRGRALHRYLLELKKGIDEGVPVLGYLQWSFLDNFEWAQGYDERFGIVYVDYRTGTWLR